jgi:hypothetical protein
LTRFSIHEAPADLPDGQYVQTYRQGLEAAQQKVQRLNGSWIARNYAP